MWQREYHAWHSPSLLGRRMELLVFGHAGARVIAFPTSRGAFYEWEERGMVAALGEHLAQGWVQLFCVASADDESWYSRRHPSEQAQWQGRYERYVLDEVLPLSQQVNSNPYLMAAGASFGAYHALAMSCRHPELFNRAIGMSGIYDIRLQTGGYTDGEVYFQNPSEFVANEHDPWRLAAMQRQDIILATGRSDAHCAENEAFSRILWQKGIGNALRIWDGWCHDWPWWHQMIRQYIGGHD